MARHPGRSRSLPGAGTADAGAAAPAGGHVQVTAEVASTQGPALDFGTLTHALTRSITVVGRATGDWRRAPDLDLGPLDTGRLVSRRHARLQCGPRGAFLRDLGSTNGTAVAGRRLQADEPVRLRDGDIVSFGGLECRFLAAAAWPEGLQPAWSPGAREDQTRPGPR